jgi:hypothetical protein
VIVDTDPVFGAVVRVVQPAHQSGKLRPTAECRKRFPAPVHSLWYRAVIQVDGNGNPQGFTSRGRGIPRGSSTWKVLFAFPVGDRNRMDFELVADGSLRTAGGQRGDNVSVETPLPQGGAPVPPVGRGGRIPLHEPSAGIGGNLLQSREWFELVMNFEMVSETEYIQRYFARQLTIGGGRTWSPRPFPTWLGYRHQVTSGPIAPYYRIHLGGNKSQSNDGPNDQFVRWGPWEVTVAGDPYGWDRYGR